MIDVKDDRDFLMKNTDLRSSSICSRCYNNKICKYRKQMENIEAKLETEIPDMLSYNDRDAD